MTQFEFEIAAELAAAIGQGTPEWYELRRGNFTASKVHLLFGAPTLKAQKEGEVFGAGALSYIREVAMERYFKESLDSDDLSHMKDIQRGVELEPEARNLMKATEFGVFIHQSLPIVGSPDGLRNGYPIEIKCPRKKGHMENILMATNGLKDLHTDYYYQLQCNIWLSGAAHGYFISYNKEMKQEDLRLFHIRVPIDTTIDFEARIGEAGKRLEAYITEWSRA